MEMVTAKLKCYGPTTRSRSKSSDARWLEHTDGVTSIQKDLLMQPYMSKKKSVTKLETKDLESANKYALVTIEGPDFQVCEKNFRSILILKPLGRRFLPPFANLKHSLPVPLRHACNQIRYILLVNMKSYSFCNSVCFPLSTTIGCERRSANVTHRWLFRCVHGRRDA